MNLLANVSKSSVFVIFLDIVSSVSPDIVSPILCFVKSDICSKVVSFIYGLKSSKYMKFGVLSLLVLDEDADE